MEKLKYIITMTMFGTIGLLVKNIELTPSEIVFYRSFIAMIVIFGTVLVMKRGKFNIELKGNWLPLLVSGLMLCLNWAFVFTAYMYTSISNAILCYYMAPIFVMILSPVILKERFLKIKYLFVFLSILGMGFLIGANLNNLDNRNLIGIGFGILSAVFYATLIISSKLIKNINSIEVALYQFFIIIIVLLPYIYKNNGIRVFNIPFKSLILLLILGVVHSGIGYMAYISSVRKLKSDVIAIYSYIDPIVTIVLSTIFFHEKIGLLQVVGGILILGSTFLSEMWEIKHKGAN
ncbi:MAG: DMT family transporter [Fusobacteriaceae bacterium]|jgi:drug/metabolite transporter (DMT)-like permease|nr:DMT family transporter [Fusobacteriaceae bacterium]